MDPLPTIITGIVLALTAIVSGLIAWHQYRLNHRDHVDSKLRGTIKQVAAEANKPLEVNQAAMATELARTGDRLNRIEDLQLESNKTMKTLVETLAKMSVKVDLYWTTFAASQQAVNHRPPGE